MVRIRRVLARLVHARDSELAWAPPRRLPRGNVPRVGQRVQDNAMFREV